MTTYTNTASADMTPSACRDRLTDLALSVLEKHGKLDQAPKGKAFGEFRGRLDPKPKPGGGYGVLGGYEVPQ
jgi:hypothetical protein